VALPNPMGNESHVCQIQVSAIAAKTTLAKSALERGYAFSD